MVRVDPSDDAVWRCLVQHYRYDQTRRQWRRVTISAYDNVREAQEAGEEAAEALRAAIAAGTADPRESITGAAHYPGYLAAQARARVVRRAIEHGVGESSLRRLLDSGPLPHNTLVIGVDTHGPFRYGGGEPPEPPSDPPA